MFRSSTSERLSICQASTYMQLHDVFKIRSHVFYHHQRMIALDLNCAGHIRSGSSACFDFQHPRDSACDGRASGYMKLPNVDPTSYTTITERHTCPSSRKRFRRMFQLSTPDGALHVTGVKLRATAKMLSHVCETKALYNV